MEGFIAPYLDNIQSKMEGLIKQVDFKHHKVVMYGEWVVSNTIDYTYACMIMQVAY